MVQSENETAFSALSLSLLASDDWPWNYT